MSTEMRMAYGGHVADSLFLPATPSEGSVSLSRSLAEMTMKWHPKVRSRSRSMGFQGRGAFVGLVDFRLVT